MVQQLFNHCHDRKIHYHDKVLSFDYYYVATFTSLSQHLSFNISHFVLRQSCEMSRQSSLLTLSLASTLLRHSISYCDITYASSIEVMSRHFETISRQFESISRHFCLSQFMPLFLLDLLILHSKPTKHKVSEYSIIQHSNE